MHLSEHVGVGIRSDAFWFSRFGNVERVTQVAPTLGGTSILWDTQPGGADVGADVVVYDGLDPTIVGSYSGLPLVPFTLPMTAV